MLPTAPILDVALLVLVPVLAGVSLDTSIESLQSANIGKDPVTGLGTPDYGRMLGLFLSLP